MVDRMKREFSVDANVGTPQVSYRETIRKSVEVEGKFIHQSGGRGQYGHVWIRLEPHDGYKFVNEITGGTVPKEYIGAIDKGIQEQLNNGVLAGYPMINVKATLYDGSYHDVDSNEMAFRIAASMAVKTGAIDAKAVLLEPIMQVEVVTPEEYMGDVMGDVTKRRGIVNGMDDSVVGKIIRAEIPLSEMFGYATNLRSATQGRASYSMVFGEYAETPKKISELIINRDY